MNYELEEVTGVFALWFRVKWAGYEETEWERESLLAQDGCIHSIRSFGTKSGLNPAQDFHADPVAGCNTLQAASIQYTERSLDSTLWFRIDRRDQCQP